MSDFKKKYTFEKRYDESKRILIKYPTRIPVIVEKIKSSDIDDIDKRKFLVPDEMTVGQFIFIIRKRVKLTPHQAIFIFVGNNLPPTASLISELYKNYKDEDGFLYINYSGENTFG